MMTYTCNHQYHESANKRVLALTLTWFHKHNGGSSFVHISIFRRSNYNPCRQITTSCSRRFGK